jgi:histone H3/H4
MRIDPIQCLLLATILSLAGDILAAPPAMSPAPRVKSIVDQIGVLEGDRDPKCDATAARLEDFMYGTTLAPDARFLKNDRQKALIVSIWSRASRKAQRAGAASIPREAVDAAIGEAIQYRQDGMTWQVSIGGRSQAIDATDKRQYSTVAYALRAILAVEQDQLLGNLPEMLPLEDEAIARLKDAVDLYTLAMLQRADRDARAAKERTITRSRLATAWPEPAAPPPAGAPRTARAVKGYPVLQQVIEQKLRSFEKYNAVSNQVFMRNLQVYFARHRWPADPGTGTRFRQVFTEAMIAYSQDLLRGAERTARGRGRTAIAAPDVYDFAQRITPHRMNEYEDAIFFPALPREERVEIEAYDMDSFRDGGLHWRYLQQAIAGDTAEGHLEPDPFAAELLTENIAQFGVLLLKETGRLGRAAGRDSLHPDYIEGALREIQRKIDLNAAAAVAPAEVAGVRSAAGAPSGGRFADVTAASGIDYRHRNSDWLGKQLRTFIRKDERMATLTVPPAFQGSGVAAEDLDGDGRPDVLLLGGAGIRLYLNEGGGRFRDATQGSGLDWRREDGHAGEARQVVVADLDNDGRQDVLVTFVDDDHRVWRNLGGGRFEDMTQRAGLGGKGAVAGPAVVLDIDRDGLPDIYIAHFGDYLRGVLPTLARRNTNAIPNRLFRNRGGFRFADITEGSGTANTGWAQAVTHTDLDGDGWQDIVVGNDFGVNAYLRNKGDGTFEDIAATLGTDKPSYAMGLAVADLNGDDRPDIYISNIVVMDKDQKYVLPGEQTVMKFDPKTLANMRVIEANDLFLSSLAKDGRVSYRQSTLVDRGYAATGWSWDAHFFDMDKDGDDDLHVVNGVNPYNVYSDFNPYYTDPAGKARDAYLPPEKTGTNILFANEGGRLDNATEGSGLGYRGNSRSAAYLDMDGDGDLDVVLNNLLEPAVVYRNASESNGNHWLAVRLVGDPAAGSSRDALGARLLLHTSSGNVIWREVRSTGGYLSSNPKEQHFGLGKDTVVRLSIRWPGGAQSEVRDLAVNGRYEVHEKGGRVRPVAAPGRAPATAK